METFYMISTLHLPDSGREINEEDRVTLKLKSGSVFVGAEVAELTHDSMRITYDDCLDGEINVPYREIESIITVWRTKEEDINDK